MDIDESLSDSAYLTDPQKLSWIITDETKALIDRAESSLLEARQDYDSEMLSFEVYGSDYMKQIAKSSPDTFIQMVLQLAWYRQYNQPTPVYETGSTRKFLHGRTETIRSLSQESLDFVKIFDSKETLVIDFEFE